MKALRAVVAESPIAHGYGGVAGLSAEAEGTDPVAALIEHALTGVAGDPAFRGNDHAYTVRVAAGDAPFGLVVTKVGDD